jgi:uncharacterized protein with GYD domain
MPVYLTRFKQTPETWARLIENPEDRRGPVGAAVEAAGGRLLGFWYAFGEYDGYALTEGPSNVDIASVLTGVVASGAFSAFETTALLTVEEMLDALTKAKGASYRPPGIHIDPDRWT